MRIDATQTIKDKLTMRDVLERYGYTPKKRIPCPIHNGKDDNFEVKEKTYCCHSHCGGGDVISFVQKLYGLSFPETLRKIDVDFNLNIYGNHTFEELRQSHYKQKAVVAERQRKQKQKEKLEEDYWAAFDEWKRLDDNRRMYKPKSQNEDLHPLFIESLQKLDQAKQLMNEADERRNRNV